MQEQVLHRDLARGRPRGAVRRRHDDALELGDELRDRIGQGKAAALVQHHRGDRRHRLGHRIDAKQRAIGHRRAGLEVLHAGRPADRRACRDGQPPQRLRRLSSRPRTDSADRWLPAVSPGSARPTPASRWERARRRRGSDTSSTARHRTTAAGLDFMAGDGSTGSRATGTRQPPHGARERHAGDDVDDEMCTGDHRRDADRDGQRQQDRALDRHRLR